MSQYKKIQRSFCELKSVYSLAAAAILLALRIVLGFFANAALPLFGSSVKLSASFLPICVAGAMLGPVPAAAIGALGDVLSFIIAPTGAYFPGFTLNGLITGFVFGMAFYKNTVTFARTVIAWFVNALLVETFLSAYWLWLVYGGGSTPYSVYLCARLISEAAKCVPEILLIFFVGRLACKIKPPRSIRHKT